MNDQQQQRIDQLIGGKASEPYVHALEFVKLIDSLGPGEQVDAIRLILERFRHPEFLTGTDIQGDGIAKQRLKELRISLGGMVEGVLRYIVSSRLSSEEAAREIHRLLLGRKSEEEKTFCILGVLTADCVPYSPIPQSVTTLTNERFVALQKVLVTDIAKLRTISSFARDSAELSDLVFSVLQSHKDREEAVALLNYFIILRDKEE